MLINDGSTDKSQEICQQYIKRNNRSKLINKDNGGLSDARNTGIFSALGKYLIFLDSDDYLTNEALKNLHENYLKSKDTQIDIIAANIKTKLAKGNYKSENHYYKDLNIISGEDFLNLQIKKKMFKVSACRNIYRREFLLENNLIFRVGILHEDVEWVPKVFLSAKSVIITKIVHYVRVETDNSITRRKDYFDNVRDLINISNEKIVTYKYLSNKRLSKQLRTYYVGLILSSLSLDIKNLDIHLKKINEKKLILNSFSIKSKFKTILFYISPKLYFKVRNLFKK